MPGAFQLGDIPGPYSFGPVAISSGWPGRVGGLGAALADLPGIAQQPVDGAEAR